VATTYKDFEEYDMEKISCITHTHNLVCIRGVAPGAKIGVIDTRTGEMLLYGEADGLGFYEGEVDIPEGTSTRTVSIRVRWPQEPLIEKVVEMTKPLDRAWIPKEDWMDGLYG
jgi:hypothetical protein